MSHTTYEEKLKRFIQEHKIRAEHLHFDQSCHSVEQAAQATQATIDDFVKNICMIDPHGKLIVAVVKGHDRASTKRVASALAIDRPRIATPEEMLTLTGYPCGGTPSFGFNAVFIVDPNVMKNEYIFTGGGSSHALVKINPQELLKTNKGTIARVRK